MTFVLVSASANDYPQAHHIRVFTDRVVAADAWRLEVLEAEGYGRDPDEVDTDTLTQVGSLADDFLINLGTDLEWTVNSNSPVDEMVTIQLVSITAK